MKVDIVKACNEIYGKKTKESWPGTIRTNLNEYANACYGSCARLHNFQSNSQVLASKEGKKCQRAMYTQLKLNGKNPCANWLPAPIIDLPPRVSFFNKIKKGLIPEQVRDNCLKECKNQKCKNNVIFDYTAYIMGNPPAPPPPAPPSSPLSPPPPPPPPPHHHRKRKKHHKKKCKNCDSEYKDIYLLIIFSLLLIGIFIIYFKIM